MKTDPSIHGHGTLPDACSEAALRDDKMAINIANEATDNWNRGKNVEIDSARRLQSENIQQQMADELFAAIMDHLNIIPKPVKDKVIAKFQDIKTIKPISNIIIGH